MINVHLTKRWNMLRTTCIILLLCFGFFINAQEVQKDIYYNKKRHSFQVGTGYGFIVPKKEIDGVGIGASVTKLAYQVQLKKSGLKLGVAFLTDQSIRKAVTMTMDSDKEIYDMRISGYDLQFEIGFHGPHKGNIFGKRWDFYFIVGNGWYYQIIDTEDHYKDDKKIINKEHKSESHIAFIVSLQGDFSYRITEHHSIGFILGLYPKVALGSDVLDLEISGVLRPMLYYRITL